MAYTDLGVPLAEPARAYQWDTLVMPGHRGHRLVSTWNAAVNAPMIAVNETLGYCVAGGMSQWTLDLSGRAAA